MNKPMSRLRLSILAAAFLCAVSAGALEVLPKKPFIPADNPQTPEKIELGKKLFFDPRLSKEGNLSCNSCHNVMAGGDDNRALSLGIGSVKGGRSAPTVWNAAFMSVQFWDGRAPTLEEQAKGPLINPVEMGMGTHEYVIGRIKDNPGYQAEFQKIFGGKTPVTIDNVAKAIAAYERTLLTPNSPVDRYLKGNKKALSEAQIRGMKLVQELGCVSCHSGPNYAGPNLPVGTGFYMKFPTIPGTDYEKKYELTKDPGRFKETMVETDQHMWRVPTWRNVALTAPYFHNGSVKTLDEAVRVMAKTQLNKELKPDEVNDVVAFLNGLTGEFPKQTLPVLPPTPNRTQITDDSVL